MSDPSGVVNQVVVVGNIGIDTNIYLAGADIDWSREGNFTENIDYIGQAGGYASRGYTRLGWRTAFIGHVGNDFSGNFIREELAREEIDSRALFCDPAGTSRSVNIMYRDGRRKNFYDGKSHMTLRPDLNICREVMLGARLAHFNIPNWARWLLPAARELGLVIACDLQDIAGLDDPYRRDFIQGADILFFSSVNQNGPRVLIESMLNYHPGIIVLSGMGSRGCALGTREGIRYFPALQMDESVIDTNGAGDALAVGFLSSYVLEGYSLEDSVRRGQIAARYTCSIRASTDELISHETLEKIYNSA